MFFSLFSAVQSRTKGISKGFLLMAKKASAFLSDPGVTPIEAVGLVCGQMAGLGNDLFNLPNFLATGRGSFH